VGLNLTILSLSPNPGAGTKTLVSVVREVAFLHIPSSVAYGSLTLSIPSSSTTERLAVVFICHPHDK